MDEEKLAAYLNLIQQLLTCPNGEEGWILNANRELVNGEFLQVCQRIAEQMEYTGRHNEAQFLRQLVQQLGRAINQETRGMEPQGTEGEYWQFWLQVLQATLSSNGDLMVVYPLLQQNLDKLNITLAETLKRWASQIFGQFAPEQNPSFFDLQQGQYIAAIVKNFGNLIHRFPLGNRAENLEIAIAAYNSVLQIITHEASPENWADIQNDLGVAYGERIRGERADNLEKEIAAYQRVLQVRTREACPELWATAQHNLGSAYSDRIRGERAENIEEAILAFHRAFQVRTREAFPQDWANTQNNLGDTYRQRIKGERAENIEEAILAFHRALQVRTREAFPQDWAMTQNNLGLAYSQRIKGERAENIEEAIHAYQRALQVHTNEAFPQNWAMTQYNLANAYRNRIRGERADNLEQAILFHQSALSVYTRHGFPEQWAGTQKSLGDTYRDRIRGERADNLEQAILFHQSALNVYTCHGFPQQWANLQNSLGVTYLDRIRGEHGQNLEEAIAAFQKALQVYTCEAFPEGWAAVQDNLGNAYSKRITGEQAENLEQAILFHQAALRVHTLDAFPEQWAGTQNNLGNIYRTRIRGERAENLEEAISACQRALQVYTRQAFPQQWAMVQHNLAAAYSYRITGEQAQNLEEAIAAYQLALQVYTREAFPQDWAMTQNNLGNAYLYRIQGERSQNIEEAIRAYQLALEVRTREGFPKDWATTQNNLGIAYRRRITGEQAQNLAQAIIAFQSALQERTREGFPKDWADTQNNLGNAYLDCLWGDRSQNIEEAIGAFLRALQVRTREAFPQDWAMTQNNLGNAYRNRIAGERDQNLEKAVRSYELALKVRTPKAFPQDYAETLFNQGLAYRDLGQLNQAYRVFKQAIDTVEYLRGEIISGDEAKRKLNEYWNILYLSMVEVCLDLNNPSIALEYVDRSKARNLTELIATRDAYPGGDIPAEVRQRLQELRQAIPEEDRRIKQDPKPDYTHISELREEFQAKYPYKQLKLPNIQSLLDDETVILEWYVLDDKFLTFTLTRQSLNLWTSSQEDLNNLIDWFNAYLHDYRNNKTQWQNNLPQRLEQLAQILHLDEILQNLREKFPNCKKLILIPHRFLHLFPLHALPIATGENQRQTLQELFSKGVNYSPNCQVLQQAKKRINQRPDFDQLFAIQNPTNDLDFTDIEVEAIQNYFNPHHILKHEKAEKTALNLNTAHCTHFSCHGYFNFNNPLHSALLLAKSILQPPPPQNDETRYLPLENGNFLDLDKCLTLEDILRLDLTKCRLVTLSACETGITDFTSTSDEYIGLPSGFILAGSPNVVSSLWAVNDLSTALLMIRFYQNVKNGETVPLALREAQIWLRDATVEGLQVWSEPILDSFSQEDLRSRLSKMDSKSKPFASPYYWAGFCAIGA